MTIDDVKIRLERIRMATLYNSEAAHAMEDRLHLDVLRAIAKNDGGPAAALAQAALRSTRIVFERWWTNEHVN